MLCFLFLVGTEAFADGEPESNKFTISGYVVDAKTGENQVGATFYITELQSGSVSNVYGFYSLSLLLGNYSLSYHSYIGYRSDKKIVQLDSNLTLNIEQEATEHELEEVVIIGERQDKNIRALEMSVSKID